MEDILVPIFVCAILFVGLPWIVLHYVSQWKRAPKITEEDERMLDEMYNLARRLEDRLNTVERIVAADNPDWKPGLNAPQPTFQIDRNPPGATDMAARTKFYLDKQDAKWKGVCAGIADYTGVDVLWVRLAVALMTLAAQQWWIILAYIVIAKVAEDKPTDLYQDAGDAKFWQGVRSNPKRSSTEVRSKLRDIDRRLADMELHYTSRNTALADEIDRLR